MNLILRNIHIISPADDIDTITDLYIKDGIIKKIGNVNVKTEEINCKGLTCTPGFYDMHVHFREPGQTHKEDLSTGCEAAANGGFTGVLCMPNTSPVIDNAGIIKFLIEKVKNELIDVSFTGALTKGRKGDEISPILSMHKAGAAGFTDDGTAVEKPGLMLNALKYTHQVKSVLIQHAEDSSISKDGLMNEGETSTRMGIPGQPAASETVIAARDIMLVQYIEGSKYHIQHISCAETAELIRYAKSKKLNVTSEVCPHHFMLTDEICEGYNTNAKMNPPLRTQNDVDAILQALKDDTIDVICTDHAPHTSYEKNTGFKDAPFGIIGLETAFGLTYTYLVEKGIITFNQMIEKMCYNPRKILNLPIPKIQISEKANLSIFNLKKKWMVNSQKFKSKSRNTPFDGYELTGKPYMVINKGKLYRSSL